MHIERLPSGRWSALVWSDGKRHRVTRDTKAEARHAGAELLMELGSTTVERGVTVGDLIHGHLTDVEGRWSPTTLADARRVARRLPEAFLARRVAEVTPHALAVLYRQLERDGWSAHRIRRAHMLLSVAWRTAVTYRWSLANPCKEISPPSPERRRVVAPEQEQVNAVLDAADGRLHLFLRVSAITGARRGEVVALQWADVDLNRAEVTIMRSLVQTTGPMQIRSTKTGAKAHRRLALDLPTVALLHRLKLADSEEALKHGLPAPVWVFADDAGQTPWRPGRVTQAFGRIAKAIGVEGVHLHSLRHAAATQMLQDGESAIDVAAQLGHATPSTTLSVYAHYLPGRGRDSADKRARRLSE